MSNSSDPYDPANWVSPEPADAVWNERSYLAGILIGAVAYGVHATLFFITFALLWGRRRTHWRDYIWITYICVLFALSSLANGMQFWFTQLIYIDQGPRYPGGLSAFIIEQQSQTAAVWCVGAYIVNNWLQDGLILYRFWIIYGKRFWPIVLPGLVFLADVGISTALMVSLSRESFFLDLGAQLLTAYFSLSVGLNILLTAAIVGKLYFARRKLRSISSATSLSHHTSVAAMLIESALLYSVCGIIFLVPFSISDFTQNLVLPTLGQVESIAPLLIIMRVAQGQAWSSETSTRVANSSMGMKRTGVSTIGDDYGDHTRSATLALSTLHRDRDIESTVKVDDEAYGGSFVRLPKA
ncbi:hypothetical protein EXIGLDRAFT_677842 [Exidia glandulosa HHB12029]|uniref:Uncharacterized protein n=1 Tax=Exidia glandulosa HHB12029 TaxID=1314781 RepID=A0A165FVN0_EXIGL|nr:hypothetical protein EXIGLDRAFT_677842 [Exidia glandulosa HHB12029]